MNKYGKIIIQALLFLGLIGFSGCKDETSQSGEGRLSMNMSIAIPETSSRVVQGAPQATTDVLSDSCRIRIYGSKGLVRFYKGLDNLPSELWLATGEYRIAALTGDSVPATFLNGYYKGESNFSIKAGETTTATVVCKIVNTLVTVDYTDNLKSILTDYQVTVSSSEGSLTYTQEHTDSIGYFILPSGESELRWSITGCKSDGNVYCQSGSIQNVKGAMKYALSFNYNETEYTEGGAYFNLTVDASPIEKVEDIVIYKRPDISGNGFDISQSLVFESNNGTETSVWVNASSALSQLLVSGEQLQNMGLPANSVDLVSCSTEQLSLWENAGLSYRYEYDESNDVSNAKITFSESLMQNLAEGLYDISICASDMHGKQWSETLSIIVSNAVVMTEEPLTGDVWAHRATLRGKRLRETGDPISFQYRVQGSATWQSAEAVLSSDDGFYALVSGLESGTTYEYRAVSGSMASTVSVKFTTESEFVIPNAGFENWHKSEKVWLVCGENEDVWWDTGNHGSATMNINVTTQDTSLKHSGTSSIKMQSQFVGFAGIGKFAAGNVFAGVFSGTEGMNGILDFGRPMTSRPSQLKGYYKYVTGTVDYSETSELPTGNLDMGNIYIAIGDWDAPVHITTKDKTIFNKNDEHIIGFGEIIQRADTEGDDLIPFSIDIEYRATDRIPTYIVIVASASYYGDFFTGSTSSTLWLDDLELVYE